MCREELRYIEDLLITALRIFTYRFTCFSLSYEIGKNQALINTDLCTCCFSDTRSRC